MNLLLKSNNICLPDCITSGVIEIENGIITAIHPYDHQCENMIDYEDQYILPGLIDIHTHGYGGWAFDSTLQAHDLSDMTKRFASLGVTSLLASSSVGCYQTLVDWINSSHKHGANILGIHAEGPFLNDVRHGAAPPGTHFPTPNLDYAKTMFHSAKGYLKYMTIAPELVGASEICQWMSKNGIVMAAGHTEATYNIIQDAVNRLSIQSMTHLGNAMTGIHHREVGAFGAGLLIDPLYCEIIGDGIHLSNEMLSIIFKSKPLSKLILISDSIALGGVEPGQYQLKDLILTISDDGIITNQYGHISGSSKPLIYGVQNILSRFDLPMYQVINMATLNPAKLLKIDNKKGSIEVGKDADLLIATALIEPIICFRAGIPIYHCQDSIIKQNPNLKEVIKDPQFLNFYE